jgi:squalene-associated FAD-dependent desaturase
MTFTTQALAVIGGGLAGMAAAAAAVQHGFKVELFEQSGRLGGRASSFEESWNGRTIDHCRHAAMGCCTNFLDFCRRTGVEDCFQRHKTLHFLGPDDRQYDFAAVGWLPAPFHLLPGLFRLQFLSLRERWSVIRTLNKLVRLKISETNERQTIGEWLRGQGQSEAALERFWSGIVTGALAETVDFASLTAAKKVFSDGFAASRNAYELILPRFPLDEIFNRRVPGWLERQGVRIHRHAHVTRIDIDEHGIFTLTLADGRVFNYQDILFATPYWEVDKLLFSKTKTPSWQSVMQSFQPAAITAVHLWFDRPITPLPHAILVGKLSQWLFNDNVLDDAKEPIFQNDVLEFNKPARKDFYYQVVISASHRLVKQDNERLLQTVHNELKSIFPEAREAKLLHSRIVVMPRAVFSMPPGLENLRPPQQTSIPHLFLAGDWTATGWPGTMEGAVRSGYLAVERLLQAHE